MGQPKERTLTPGETGSLSLPWKPISQYPRLENWCDGPIVVLAWPEPSHGDGYDYGIGYGTLQQDFNSDEYPEPMIVQFMAGEWPIKPTHYLPLFPPGQ
jgi:hypothetical protein